MKYMIGVVLFACGGWLLHRAYGQRRRVLAALGGTLPERKSDIRSLETFGNVMRPILIGFLIYSGIKSTFLFFAFEAQKVLSIFDLAGFLFLLGSYATWLTLTTKYRETLIPKVPAETAAAAAPAVVAEGPALQVVDGGAEACGELKHPDRDRNAARSRARDGVRDLAGPAHAPRSAGERAEARRRSG